MWIYSKVALAYLFITPLLATPIDSASLDTPRPADAKKRLEVGFIKGPINPPYYVFPCLTYNPAGQKCASDSPPSQLIAGNCWKWPATELLANDTVWRQAAWVRSPFGALAPLEQKNDGGQLPQVLTGGSVVYPDPEYQPAYNYRGLRTERFSLMQSSDKDVYYRSQSQIFTFVPSEQEGKFVIRDEGTKRCLKGKLNNPSWSSTWGRNGGPAEVRPATLVECTIGNSTDQTLLWEWVPITLPVDLSWAEELLKG